MNPATACEHSIPLPLKPVLLLTCVQTGAEEVFLFPRGMRVHEGIALVEDVSTHSPVTYSWKLALGAAVRDEHEAAIYGGQCIECDDGSLMAIFVLDKVMLCPQCGEPPHSLICRDCDRVLAVYVDAALA